MQLYIFKNWNAIKLIFMNTLKVSLYLYRWGRGWRGQNLKKWWCNIRGGLRMRMVDDGGGRGVKNGRKSDDVINGRPHFPHWNMRNETLSLDRWNETFPNAQQRHSLLRFKRRATVCPQSHLKSTCITQRFPNFFHNMAF